jgi:hypothetical protein
LDEIGQNWTNEIQVDEICHHDGSEGMTLSDFLKILYKYYGNGEQTATFVRNLFYAAIDNAYELFPDDSLPQKLYNGNNVIGKITAKKILPNLNREAFINYLDNLTDDAILNLCIDFGIAPPDINVVTDVEAKVFGKIYEMLVSYVNNAGKKAYRFASSSQIQLWDNAYTLDISQEHDVYGLREVRENEKTTLSMLIEADGKCPLCRNSLLRDKNGKNIDNYVITYIYPVSPTAEVAITLAKVKKISVNLDSSYNRIALCPECSSAYQADTSVDEYNRLAALKKNMLTYNTARARVDDAKIEQEIEEVVRRLAVANPSDYMDLNYDAVSVEDKILRDNTLFFQKVFNNVVERFNCIKDIFNQLSHEHRLNFEEVATEMRLAFMKADKDGLPQEQVFELLVEKIRGSSHSLSTSACEAVIAFFVQDCEVFDVIAK